MKFAELAKVFEQLEKTSSRTDMTRILGEFLPKLDNDEIKPTMYLFLGRLAPLFVPIEFNVSKKLIQRIIQDEEILNGHQLSSENSNLNPEEYIKAMLAKLGDEGLVVEQLLISLSKEEKELSILDVYEKLYSVASISGSGSQDKKMKLLSDLILSVGALSARYIVRVVIGNLRLGLSDKTILDALSWAKTGDKSFRTEIEKAYGVRADIGEIAVMILSTDIDDLKTLLDGVTLLPGTPIASKLVEREKNSIDTFNRLGKCIVQPKLDGLRAQIHFDRGLKLASVFSRNMENMTEMFPDLVSAVEKLKVDSIIIDSEAIGYDQESDIFLPFQETIQRKRKHGVDEHAVSIPIKAMAFDLLYLNGTDMSQKPVEERIHMLKELLMKSNSKTIELLDSPIVSTADELDNYFREQISKGLEGIIAKKLGTNYAPGTRNFDWIKLKANTQSELVDTIDAVVLGYYIGRGDRAKFGVGALLVGVLGEDGNFYTTAKVGTGMKDEDWRRIKEDLDKIKIKNKPNNVIVTNALLPDTWVSPEIVMEIEADEITRSPGHTAAANKVAKFEKDNSGRGLSLRFPRMKIWKRDKLPTQATSELELLRMFELEKGF